jgi:hypothetical protein
LGTSFVFFHIFIHLPTAWIDIHRELAQLHRSLSEIQSLRRNDIAETELSRTRITLELADHYARLTDDSARLTEHESEMLLLTERIDEVRAPL